MAKNNHSLSLYLSFFLSLFLFAADVCYFFFFVLVIYAVVAYCFTRTSLKSTLDALLALVNLKHASPSGAGKTETVVELALLRVLSLVYVECVLSAFAFAFAFALPTHTIWSAERMRSAFSFDLQLLLFVVFCVC